MIITTLFAFNYKKRRNLKDISLHAVSLKLAQQNAQQIFEPGSDFRTPSFCYNDRGKPIKGESMGINNEMSAEWEKRSVEIITRLNTVSLEIKEDEIDQVCIKEMVITITMYLMIIIVMYGISVM